jgi:hypothetical protein
VRSYDVTFEYTVTRTATIAVEAENREAAFTAWDEMRDDWGELNKIASESDGVISVRLLSIHRALDSGDPPTLA